MDLGRVFICNMKKYRKLREFSQEKLAALCDASPSFIRQIECGSKYPSFGFIGKLAAALDVPPSLLFTDEEGENRYEQSKKAQIEAELTENMRQLVRSAFSRL